MVFLSSVLGVAVRAVKIRGPDRFWRRQKILRMSALFYGRRRNCYRIAVSAVHRALLYATESRKLKRLDAQKLWETRISAGCQQNEIDGNLFRFCLKRLNIFLNRKVLSEIAVFEPRTFKCLTEMAKSKAIEDGLNNIDNLLPPQGVFTRNLLKK